MAHPFIKAACASAGLVLALVAAGTAQAAKPITGKPSTSNPSAAKQPLSIKQKNDLARAMARPGAAKAAVPKSIARAKSAITVASGGDESSVVPEELDHYLTAQADANGRMRVRDFDPNTQPAAAVEATHEK